MAKHISQHKCSHAKSTVPSTKRANDVSEVSFSIDPTYIERKKLLDEAPKCDAIYGFHLAQVSSLSYWLCRRLGEGWSTRLSKRLSESDASSSQLCSLRWLTRFQAESMLTHLRRVSETIVINRSSGRQWEEPEKRNKEFEGEKPFYRPLSKAWTNSKFILRANRLLLVHLLQWHVRTLANRI